MVTLLAITNALAWTYIHGWYFGVQGLEWVSIYGVYTHGLVIS